MIHRLHHRRPFYATAMLWLMVILLPLTATAQSAAPLLPGSALDSLNKLVAGAPGISALQTGGAGGASNFSGQNFSDLPWQNSLMFDETQLDQLYNAMVGFAPTKDAEGKPIGAGSSQSQDRVTVDAEGRVFDPAGNLIATINENNILIDLEGKMIGRVEDDKRIVDNDGNYMGRDTRIITKVYPSVAPAFYLNSVMFYIPKNWTLWLNHRRIRVGTEMNGLTVVNIHEDFVDMLWKPADLDFIAPDWKKKVLPLGDNISKDLGVPYSKDQLGALEKELNDAKVSAAKAKEAAESAMAAALKAASQPQVTAPASVPGLQPADTSSLATNGAKNTQPQALNIKSKVSVAGQEEPKKQLPKPTLSNPPKDQTVQLPDLAVAINPATGALTINNNTLLDTLKKQEDEKRKAKEEEAKKKEEEILAEKQKAEQEKLEKKREVLEKKHKELYANQAVDESKYKWEYKSPDGLILVDPVNKMVKFRVGLNQTFVSRSFELKEGYVQSVALTPPTEGGQQSAPASTNNLEQQLFDYSNLPTNSVIPAPKGGDAPPGLTPPSPQTGNSSPTSVGQAPGGVPATSNAPAAAPRTPKPLIPGGATP
jgi:hypothetical protein